jgi:ABC-type sugar transport system substrate-binding protein
MRASALISIAFGLILASASAQAAEPWQAANLSLQQQSAVVWREMQDCAQQAALRVRDHTPEANRQREAMRLNCLRVHHLPIDQQPIR